MALNMQLSFLKKRTEANLPTMCALNLVADMLSLQSFCGLNLSDKNAKNDEEAKRGRGG